jgi:3',5'-cyclic AMP phosphodiesterase CpdA
VWALQIARALFRDKTGRHQPNDPLPGSQLRFHLLPEDIQELFTLIQRDAQRLYVDLYHIHTSFLPISVGMQATVKMVDHVLHGMPKLLRDKILLYLHQHIDPNRRNLVANPLLAAAYNHKQGAYRVNDYKVAMKNGFTSVHAMKRGGLSNEQGRSYVGVVPGHGPPSIWSILR